jgi:hypothetical protein
MNMKGKAAAVLVTCLMFFSGMAQVSWASGPDGPSGGPGQPAARGSTPDNDSEPNDDFANSTLVTGSVTFSGGVGGGDMNDYFKISLQTGATADTLDVRLTLDRGITILEVLDPNHFVLLRDSSLQSGVTLRVNLTAFLTGYYYIHMPDRGPCNYTLVITKGTNAFSTDGDNDPSTATVIVPTGGSIKTYNASSTLDNRSDIHDLYNVHLDFSAGVRTDVLKAFLKVPATGSFGLLLHAQGKYEPADAQGNEPDTMVMGTNQTLTYSPLAAGDYYLRIWCPAGFGSYDLNVSLVSGSTDQNDAIDFASSLDKTGPHWYNLTSSLTLGIDQDDYYQMEGAVPGQVFNCTVTSTNYDARDGTPNIQISLWNNSKVPIPPDPPEALAKPVAYANARVQEEGIVYVQLYLTKWAGEYSLSIYTNSPPQVEIPPENISFPENTNNTTIKLGRIFSDPENDPLAFSYEMFGEINGNITVNISDDADRTVTLAPKKNWRGSGSMSWTATDPNGEAVTVMIDNIGVTRINHRPEINLNYTIPPISIAKGGWDNTTLNMNSVYIDPDGDRMKYAASGNEHIRVSFPLDPENGVWPTGEVMFLPDPGWLGSEVITLNATDFTEEGKAMLASLPVYVTAEVVEVFIEKITVGTASQLNLTEDGTDQSLLLNDYFSSNYPNDTFAILYMANNASRMNVTLAPDSRLTVKPQADWSGQETIRFKATCLHGLTGNLSVAVNVAPVNDLPYFVTWSPNTTDVVISEGQSQKFKVSASDKESSGSQLKLNWSLDGAKVSSLTDYEFIANYDTVVGQTSKTFNLTVTVNDTQAQVSLNWKLTVNNLNRPPRDARITFPPDGSAYDEGAKVHMIGAAADDDNDQLTLKWYDGAKLLGIGPEFNITKLKVGRHNITLEVSDGTDTTNATITIKINAKKSPGFEIVAAVAATMMALVIVGMGRRKR